MELKQIGEKLGVENRTMRYLMEQGIVPGLNKVNRGRGTRRELTQLQADLVGLAAMLHELGFRGPVMQNMLRQAKPRLHDAIQDQSITLPIKNMEPEFHACVVVSLAPLRALSQGKTA